MSTKPKKPKARRMYVDNGGDECVFSRYCTAFLVEAKREQGATPVAVLDVSDEAALIEVFHAAWWKCICEGGTKLEATRAGFTALGVLPKRKAK